MTDIVGGSGLVGTKVIACSIVAPLPPGMSEKDALAMAYRGLTVNMEFGQLNPNVTITVMDSSTMPPPGGFGS